MLTVDRDALIVSFPELSQLAVCRIEFQRTLRVPDDNREYPLPPGLGCFPLTHVDDTADRVPANWIEHGGVFLPMYQGEAMWLNFSSPHEYPFAIKIAAGKVNAVTGAEWTQALSADEQDYVEVPGQPWLDGFCVGPGHVRQFVAMPLGSGYSVEEQLTAKAEHGGLQIIVYPLKPELYTPPSKSSYRESEMFVEECQCCSPCSSYEMGLAAGGLMMQQIYAATRAISDWRQDVSARCFVHILNSQQYMHVTGKQPPYAPPTAATYTARGLPWFDYYQDAPVLSGGTSLKKVDSVAALGIKKGEKPLPENAPVSPSNVHALGNKHPKYVREGEF